MQVVDERIDPASLATAPAIRTTDGTIALINLQAQIDGLSWHAAQGQLSVQRGAGLVELVSLRGHVLGCVADLERADVLAERLVGDAPGDGLAFLARATTHAAFHRFRDALVDLDQAERLGIPCTDLAAERATALQALGRDAEALALRLAAVDARGDFESYGALAETLAEQGETDAAERAFAESRTRLRGASPFPLALLDFQRGRMWLEQGQLARARAWLDAACRRLPAYAPAQGHLAEVESALGDRSSAVARLRPLAASSDDPDYAAHLALVLREDGQVEEATQWLARAMTRYDDLVARHPAAFADHAAELWLTVGNDPHRALDLANQSLVCRPTPRARDLFAQAVLAVEAAESGRPSSEPVGGAQDGCPASRQPRSSAPNRPTGAEDVTAG